MNGRTSTRFLPTVLAQVALTSTWVLVAFSLLEVLLPRAGRAAATLLLRVDSGILRWIESAGSQIHGFSANGILFSALVTAVAATARGFPRLNPGARLAAAGVASSGIWAFARRASGDPRDLWGPAAVSAALAAAALVAAKPRLQAVFAVVLQGGLLAYAGWALLVSSGSTAHPLLDQASEILVLSGIAGAGLATFARGAPLRLVLAVAAFAATCVVAAIFPDGSHSILRHIATVGNSGLPFAATVPLFAAALAGLILSTARPGLFAPLLVASVCARRPEAHLIAGVIASSALLVAGLARSRRQAAP